MKIKVKVQAKFTLEQAMKAQRGVEVKLDSFFNIYARYWGWLTPRPSCFDPAE
jgi:hypothetical protein